MPLLAVELAATTGDWIRGTLQLTLAIHPIDRIRFGDVTQLAGETLDVSLEELRANALEDARVESVEFEIVAPGEGCRIGGVYDIVEPRAKHPADGVDFPGVLGPPQPAGRGTTHVLRGAAVTVLEDAGARVIEMRGEAADYSPYAPLNHLVVIPRLRSTLRRHEAENARRRLSLKMAVCLGKAAIGVAPRVSEIYETRGPGEARKEGVPRIAYIGQVHSRQRVAEVDEQIIYGTNTTGMLPIVLHPNEWLDGAILPGNSRLDTYLYQNHPVVSELYRSHQAGDISFVGTIATFGANDNFDRELNCRMAAEQAKWVLQADGVVLTKCGGGAPHADMGLTALYCERLGMRTVVQINPGPGDQSAESAVLFNYPEVDAIVYTTSGGIEWPASRVERVIAATAEQASALIGLQKLAPNNVAGVTSQQGASRLRGFVY
jgi:glycine reductase